MIDRANIRYTQAVRFHPTRRYDACDCYKRMYTFAQKSQNIPISMKSYPKWLFSRVYSDACPVRLLIYLYNTEYTLTYYNVRLDMRLSFKWHKVFEIKSVLLLSAI